MRQQTLIVLLISGGSAGADGVLARLAEHHPAARDSAKVVMLTASRDPADALHELLASGR